MTYKSSEWTYVEETTDGVAEAAETIEELPSDGEITEADVAELEKLFADSEPVLIEYGSEPAEIIESSQTLLAEAGVTYPEPSANLPEVEVPDLEIPDADPELFMEAGAALATVGGAIIVAAPWVLGAVSVSLLATGGYRMIKHDIAKRPERWQIKTYTNYFRSKNHSVQTHTQTSCPANSATAATNSIDQPWVVVGENPVPGYYIKQC